ncbi:MAG: class I SAM-dependent methyltransferase [Granulosicoccus sp.]
MKNKEKLGMTPVNESTSQTVGQRDVIGTHQQVGDSADQRPVVLTAIADWDAYSEPFLSVMPSQMLTLNRQVASYCIGHVADFGCGAGKIIPFVLERDCVDSYTGIDSSLDMIRRACWVAEQFSHKRATTIHSSIEAATLSIVDTAISINSYYAWRDSELTLRHIHSQLHPGSRFVLATINPSIDMMGLLEAAELELFAHPHWQAFKEHNEHISKSRDARFIALDPLIGEVRRVGFVVEDAHTHLYEGGLNMLQLSIA